MNRKQLETKVDSAAYDLVKRITNHAQSFVHLYINRKKAEIDHNLVDQINEVFALGIEDGFQTQIDFFSKGVEEALDKYLMEENEYSPKNSKKK